MKIGKGVGGVAVKQISAIRSRYSIYMLSLNLLDKWTFASISTWVVTQST